MTRPMLGQAAVVFLVYGLLSVSSAARAQDVAPPAAAATAPAATAPAAGREAAPNTATQTNDWKLFERQIQATIQTVSPSVVAVSGGSGVVVTEDGYVLTVAHVGQRAGRNVTVTFPDGRRARGKTLGNDEGVDAGLIKLNDPGPWPHVEMGRSADLEPGQWCLAMGYPVSFERGKPPVVRIGRVQRRRSSTIFTDCTIMGGDSGGPLFDLNGRVIGIGSRCSNELNVNISVPVDAYRNQWTRLAGGEDFNSRARTYAFLGVAPSEESDDRTIGVVYPDSAAEQAGLVAGDVLVKFDGQALERYSDLPPLVRRHKPGDAVELEIRRGDATLTLKAKLGKREG